MTNKPAGPKNALTAEKVILLARANHTWGNRILSMIVEDPTIKTDMSPNGLGKTGKFGEEGYDHTEAFNRMHAFSKYQQDNEKKVTGLWEAKPFYDVFVDMVESFYMPDLLVHIAKRIADKNPDMAIVRKNKILLPSEVEDSFEESEV